MPLRLKDKFAALLEKDDNQAVPSPTILWNGTNLSDATYAVVVDNKRVCTTTDMLLAVTVLIASYYVFNLAYPKDLEGTMVFYQNAILNIQDQTKYNRKVCNFLIEISTKL